MFSRRTMLKLLGSVAAVPAIPAVAAIVPTQGPMVISSRPIFLAGDLLYNGVIIRRFDGEKWIEWAEQARPIAEWRL